MTRFRRVCLWCLAVVALYAMVSSAVYRFRHPEMTETQLFLHLGDAMRWQP